MSAAEVKPISSYQLDDMSLTARRKRNQEAMSAARGGRKGRKTGTRTVPHQDPGKPTPERLAKGDIVQMGSGHHRAPPLIERMRDREQFCPGDGYTNERMFQAADKLLEYFQGSGLGAGVQAQDLTRIMSGSGDTPYSMAISESAAHCRKELRLALKLMGWFSAYPHRGAGRLTLEVVCFERSVRDAADSYRPGGADSGRQATGMDVLREGLFALAVHWKFLRA